MTPDELALTFLDNPEAMQEYRRAVSMLRGLGFETVVRRMGEPADGISAEHERHIEVSAIDQISKRGFHQALDLVFDFDEVITRTTAPPVELGDYGADEIVRGLGYKPEDTE